MYALGEDLRGGLPEGAQGQRAHERREGGPETAGGKVTGSDDQSDQSGEQRLLLCSLSILFLKAL